MGRGLRSITALTIVAAAQAGCQFYMDGGASVLRNQGAVRVEVAEGVADEGEGRELSMSRYILDLGGYTRLGSLPLRIMTGLWSSMDQVTFREAATMGTAAVRSSWEVTSIATVGVNLPIIRFMGHQLAPYGFYGHNWIPTYLDAPAVSTHLEVGVEVCGNQVDEEDNDGFFDSFCLRGGMARSSGRPPTDSIGVTGTYEAQGVFFMMGFRTMEMFR